MAISSMTQSDGWLQLKQDFSFSIDQLQEQINELGGNEMKYSEGDILKIRLKILKDVLDYPDKYIAMAQTQQEPEEMDPYSK